MIDRVATRDRLVRRFYERPGTVERIAAEEFPGIDPADVRAAARHVAAQCSEITFGRAQSNGRELPDPTRRRHWEPGEL